MKILYLILIAIVCFGLVCFTNYKNKGILLYMLSIGGAVNANFFHAGSYPIYCFGLPFGIDSIIYTLFVFCVILMQLKSGKKDAFLLTFSSVLAILFSAIVQFVSEVASLGYSRAILNNFIGFIISVVATIVALYFMIFLIEKLKDKNKYLTVVIAIVVATIINSVLYYGLSAICFGSLDQNFGNILLASIIGKVIALGFSLVAFFVVERKKFTTQ